GAELLAQRGSHYLQAIGRLRPGVDVAQARGEIRLLSDRLGASYPATNRDRRTRLAPLHEDLVRNLRSTLAALFASVGFLLLVAATNVASLQLARATVRQRELSTRVALGASGGRIIRQLLVENVFLSIVGAGAGLIVAIWGVDVLAALGRAQF